MHGAWQSIGLHCLIRLSVAIFEVTCHALCSCDVAKSFDADVQSSPSCLWCIPDHVECYGVVVIDLQWAWKTHHLYNYRCFCMAAKSLLMFCKPTSQWELKAIWAQTSSCGPEVLSVRRSPLPLLLSSRPAGRIFKRPTCLHLACLQAGKRAATADGGRNQADLVFSSCSVKPLQPTARSTMQPPPSDELLRRQWAETRTRASNTHHVKIERMCTYCLLRTINWKPSCRGCHRSLGGGQWPPLGCPSSFLRRLRYGDGPVSVANDESWAAFRGKTGRHGGRGRSGNGTSPATGPSCPAQPRGFPPRAASTEHACGWLQALRDVTKKSLVAAKKELQARKPEGDSLDKNHRSAAASCEGQTFFRRTAGLSWNRPKRLCNKQMTQTKLLTKKCRRCVR